METYVGFPSQPLAQPVFLTIGNFDGVHRGHQKLIGDLAEAAHAAGCLAGLLTFDPHPLAVLRPEVSLLRLTSPEERADLLDALGMDFVLALPFSRALAATPAADFMEELARRLHLRELWIGPDFALGRGREGHALRLSELGRALGYTVHVTPLFDWEGIAVRSSRVRALLADEGDVAAAAHLLGRPYRVWGVVQHGVQRGRRLGFPTANLTLPADRLAPAHGVYACWAWRDDRGYPAVVNIGVRPSFDNGLRSIEAYVLDFEGDLYGETLGLSFIERLRGEQRFAEVGELVAQINRDVETTRRRLAAPPDHAAPAAAHAWQELDHTADWAIAAQGATLRELFATAAAAMFALEDADLSHPVELARTISVSADTAPELLVAWLNALLLSQELDTALYTRFEIFELSPRGLRGVAYGHRGAPTHTAIKAVTYYDLSVTETAAGWRARVTFDV